MNWVYFVANEEHEYQEFRQSEVIQNSLATTRVQKRACCEKENIQSLLVELFQEEVVHGLVARSHTKFLGVSNCLRDSHEDSVVYPVALLRNLKLMHGPPQLTTRIPGSH